MEFCAFFLLGLFHDVFERDVVFAGVDGQVLIESEITSLLWRDNGRLLSIVV